MKKFLILFALIIILFRCGDIGNDKDDQGNNAVNIENDTSLSTPFADAYELNEIANDTEKYADWRVVRIFALFEKENFSKENDWDGTELSKRPVIIYDYKSEPKYYEFRVIKNGLEVGAIACVAQKNDGEPVKYVMDSVKNYELANSNRSDIKIIDAGYPAKVSFNLAGSRGDISQEVDPETRAVVKSNIGFEVSAKDFLLNADKSGLEKLKMNSKESYDSLMRKASEKQAEIDEMWKKIEEVKNDLLQITDEDVKVAALTNMEDMTRSTTSTFILDRWWDKSRWWNPGGSCGPNCLTFISIGADYYPGYSGTPGNDNDWAIYTVYNTFLSEVGEGAKLWGTLRSALSKYTGYTLSLSDKSHNWSKVNSLIRKNNAPAMSLRTWASINGEWCWEWHYRVICGTKRVTTNYLVYFLGIKIGTYTSRKYWYLMHDNGADGPNWWERSGSLAQFESVSSRAK